MNRQDSQPDIHAQNTHPESTGYVVLANQVIVRISGPGTDKFVQGQFSQHVDEVTANQSLRAAACNPKGRTYCLTRLVRDQQDLLMDLDAGQAEATLNHLRKYLMLFRGTTMAIVASARIVGLLGEAAAIAGAGEEARSLNQVGQTLATDSGVLIRLEDTVLHTARYEWWQLDGTPSLPDDLTELSMDHWHTASIRAGVPWLTPQSTEAYVPQMLNLQHLQGVHFKKGCYTGQEIVARMHFLGQLKKSLFRLRFSGTDTAPETGTRLLNENKSVGEVVNAVATGNQHGELLAVIRHDAQQGPFALEGDDKVTLELQVLPYPVPEREPTTLADT
ncbi:CAF17-like 4Fe-4S cluster assembly/insertion protein YgfZ [Marinobacter halophilus]|uniref:Folate-binding protein n=1 Tax=Marinobacter halophilus TaxID=1323740 RepID=A0A2T1KBB6_9GAMM|nr:folate-binding protein YgfZ [Marinobacter halophilus]PSF07426.1 folate-binding protein [Marinobacter halophilus]GGC81102.1 tRNA-modifying protein YgfZ [Marinobacter halophilus]